MPALSGRGPFSYDTITLSGTNVYVLVKALHDPTNGETLEVLVDGVKLQGVGLSIAGTIIAGDGFYVNSLSNPTTISLVTPSTDEVIIRRISNRSTPQVDFAPGSVIRESDLDDSTNQTLHVAQEAIDIALQAMVTDADNKWNAQTDSINRVIKNVANGVDNNDVANVSQMNATEVATEGFMDTTEEYKEDTEDYKLEAGDWAQKDDGAVKAYVDNATPGGALGFSAKAHAIGGTGVDVETGSSKDWATKATTPSSTAADASAKEWATGVSTHKLDASAKEYATHAQYGTVDGSSEYSAKHHAAQAKDWATKATIVRNDANDGDVDYASKEWAIGQLAGNTDGSAKQWALGGGNFVEATAVSGSDYSARRYASLTALDVASTNADVLTTAGYVDNFDDSYLGAKVSSVGGLSDTTPTPSGAWEASESHTGVTQTSTSGSGTSAEFSIVTDVSGNPTVTVTTVGSGYALTDTIVLTDPGSTSNTATITVNNIDPTLDNDGDPIADGALYFNTTLNVMKVYDLGTTAWQQMQPTTAEMATINAVNLDAVDIGKVAAIDTEIGQLAVLGTAGVDITTVSNIGTNGADVSTVAGITAGDVTKVANITTGDVSKVAAITTGDVSKVAVITTGDVSKVADITTGDVSKVAVITTGDVSKVAVITTGDVSKVADITTGDVSKVAAITTGDVTKVANITTGDVTKVADVDGEVALVAAVDGEIGLLGTNAMAHATTGHLALLGTADCVADMALLGTTDCIADMNLLATTAIADPATGDLKLVADSIADVNRYAQEYTIDPNAPGSPSEGDLWYDSTNNVLKFHNGTTFAAISAPTHNSMVDDTTPQLGGDLDLNSNDITGTGVIPAANLTGTAQVTLDVLATLITTSTTNGHIGFDKGITEKIGTGSASGTTITVDLSTGNFFEVDFANLSGNVSTFTISNPNATAGQLNNFVIKCKQHGSSNKDFTWGSLSAIDWPEQTGPEMTQTANRYDIFSFTSYNNGTNWLGAVVGQDYSY
tara:strand:- start:1285 stop:4308 length:3024 start_codon:yes stop_codon:yes gene_type:complete